MIVELRKALNSKPAILIIRIFFGLVVFALATYAIRTFQVLNAYDIQYGTDLWFASFLIIVSSTVGIICIMLMGRGWVWATWVWAVLAGGLASIGVLVGLSTKYLTQWHVLLPWIVLLLSALVRPKYAMPWMRGGIVRIAGGVIGLLVVSGLVANTIHQQVSSERDVFLEPLKEIIAEANQQLPQMMNEELRLDRVSIEVGDYHQLFTFPYDTVASLESDPGLDFVRDHYAEVFSEMICELPLCQTRLADGQDCSGTYRYTFLDMNGKQVLTFSLDGADCTLASH